MLKVSKKPETSMQYQSFSPSKKSPSVMGMTNPMTMQERVPAALELKEWMARPPKLEKADGSALHRMVAAMLGSRLIWMLSPADTDPARQLTGVTQMQSFVVQHDWASAFKGAEEYEAGDFELPYDLNCFEFRITGKRVCGVIRAVGGQKEISTIVETRNCWAMPILPFHLKDGTWQPIVDDADLTFNHLPAFMAEQIRAVCISLEAGVAAADVVTISDKLNAARVKRGKEPMPDYRVVRLMRTPAIGTGHTHEGSHTKKRLHFRRGHWRQLSETRRVWVRWCLVGNPDLGFIEKEYRL